MAGWTGETGPRTGTRILLECWNGDASLTIDRIGRGSIYVPHACVSLFGGIQPARMRDYLADALRDGPQTTGWCNGFSAHRLARHAARMAYVDRQPDTNALECAAGLPTHGRVWKSQTRSGCNLTMKLRRYSSNGLPIWSNASGAKKLQQSCKRILPSTAA